MDLGTVLGTREYVVVVRFWERFHSIRLQQPSAPPNDGSTTFQPPTRTRVAHAPFASPPSPPPSHLVG
jgi:hypothetical protein